MVRYVIVSLVIRPSQHLTNNMMQGNHKINNIIKHKLIISHYCHLMMSMHLLY